MAPNRVSAQCAHSLIPIGEMRHFWRNIKKYSDITRDLEEFLYIIVIF